MGRTRIGINLALQDLRKASRQYRVWLHLGLAEVKQRYRRSVLGPWWITISMFIFIGAMGTIFHRLFGQSRREYIPFFTTGFLLWSFITTCLNESTDIFRSNGGLIKQLNLPYSLYVFKFLVRNIIILAHNFIVYFVVIGFLGLNPGWNVVFAIPGLLLLILNMYWLSLLTALLSTRYRDVIQIVSNGLQILFFITPITWMPKLLGSDSFIVRLNPFVYFIDAVRQPLLGSAVSFQTWAVDINIAILGCLITLYVFSKSRTRIPFWVD